MNPPEIEQASIQALYAATILADRKPLFLDTETTGTDDQARIVDICLMTLDGEVVLETLINPGIPIPVEASKIHNITDEMVKDAPTWPEAAPHISHLLEDVCLAGYNLVFDLRIMDQMDRAYDLPTTYPDMQPTGDVMRIYSDYRGEWDSYHGNFRWHKLAMAAQQLGIDVETTATHRARYDCDLTRKILLALCERKTIFEGLNSFVTGVAFDRADEVEAKKALASLREELEASREWQYWSNRLAKARERLEGATANLRSLAVNAYGQIGDKSPHPAVSIRMTTRLEYDPNIARVWCSERLPKAMVLDTKYFEKHARAIAKTDPLNFVKIVEEPQAAIASDLSAYLPDRTADAPAERERIH